MKYLFLLIISLSAWCYDLQASNKVKVVTIGGGGTIVRVAGDDFDYQKMVDRIIEYWKGEFDKVLVHKPDLILLTEACDLPGGIWVKNRFDYYRVRKNQVWDYFASVAKENNCYIAFGTKHEENGIWWNSCIVLDRKGNEAGRYHKNFPTVYEMPEIRPGTETPIIQCDFGRVACTICFDLNFDELREQYAALKPDILLFPSNYHGGLEQNKWAYSCQSFFVCAYGFLTAPSEIRNPLGEVVASSTNTCNYAVATINLDRKSVHLDYNSGKLTALKKKYGDQVVITDYGKTGVVMITSEHDKISVDDMIKEFDIELLDSYFDRSRQMRLQQLKLN